MFNDLYMFGGLIVIAALAHLIGLRAERHGRRYWAWFLLALPFGPIGAVLAFLLLEVSIRDQQAHDRKQGPGRSSDATNVATGTMDENSEFRR